MIHTSEIIKIAKDQDTALKLVDVIEINNYYELKRD